VRDRSAGHRDPGARHSPPALGELRSPVADQKEARWRGAPGGRGAHGAREQATHGRGIEVGSHTSSHSSTRGRCRSPQPNDASREGKPCADEPESVDTGRVAVSFPVEAMLAGGEPASVNRRNPSAG